jgi:DNA modification methylase
MPRNQATSYEIETAAAAETSAALSTTPDDSWSFAQLARTETLWGPHGYHKYPAKFIPQLVRRIIGEYSEEDDLVGDTFLGSATTGVEALRCNRRFWGADINPVATFISKAKCTPIPPIRLDREWKRLFKRLEGLPRLGRRFLSPAEKEAIQAIDIAHADANERFEYWFPAAQAAVLENILELILELRGKRVRTFFLCAFSNILKTCSIWLSGSTKPQKDLKKRLSDPVGTFCRQVRDMIKRNKAFWEDLAEVYDDPAEVVDRCIIQVKDARRLPLDDGELDLLVTSPPYATCYQYIELHQLTQLWFERHDLLQSVRLQRHCIGGKGRSTRHKSGQLLPTGSPSADQALLRLANKGDKSTASTVRHEVRALRSYFLDMNEVIKEFARVVRSEKYFVLVVGDSCKRGVMIPTSTALTEMADAAGFDLEHKIVRKVPGRVLVAKRDQTTGRFSSTKESDIEAYPEEDVLIFKRRAHT